MKITIETEIPDDPRGIRELIDTINKLKGATVITNRFPTRQQEMSFPDRQQGTRHVDLRPRTTFAGEALEDPGMQGNGSPKKRTRNHTSDQTAEKIINLLIKDLKSVEKIAEVTHTSAKTVGEIARGKSWIRASGFEPYDNREGDEWCPSFYNRTASGRLNRRAKELVAQFTESYKKRTKIKA